MSYSPRSAYHAGVPRLLPGLLSAFAMAALPACGGTPTRQAGPAAAAPEPVELPDGQGTWRVRHNAPKCLAAQPALHFELKTAAGWERVAIEVPEALPESDPTELAEHPSRRLFLAFTSATDTAPPTVEVLATFTSDVQRWGNNHAARVLRIEEVILGPPAGGGPSVEPAAHRRDPPDGACR